MTVFYDGASGDHGGHGPVRASLYNIFFFPGEPHTHTHTVIIEDFATCS